ncbi:monovalent cation/H+ antiporter complex subunit F [Methylophaga sp.]|uniref:monovalent cation/H+ antiporter complex subunit F n=1 Tax=Methylophaga sp. TaxID=2024840 RepID=UPI002715CD95|nr:monovalent cation/H+ antiporter complex subunit F [Methylophaga sp.]MDO8828437.1 monovalent cation/H+ antiporter complex subunit F [Methylophaga sp.]
MMVLTCLLLVTIMVGLWRVVMGPSRIDRLIAVQLFGTAGTALLLLLSQTQRIPALLDAALILALLAALLSAALVQYMRGDQHD